MRGEEHRKKSPSRGDSATTPPAVPHLLDAGSLAEAARWVVDSIGAGVLAGVLANAVSDYLKNVKRRHGQKGIRKLEAEALELLEEAAGTGEVDVEAVKQKMSELFAGFR
jgi:hypothetical protein